MLELTNPRLRRPPTMLASACLLFAVLAAVPAAVAHHSQTQFDRQRTLTLEGTVAQYDWANPHVYVYVDVPTGAGTSERWEVEGQPPTILKRQGWSPETLAVGERVAITVNPPRREGPRIALGLGLNKADGTALTMGFDGAGLSVARPSGSAPAASLAGTWETILEPAVALRFLVGPVRRPDLDAARLERLGAAPRGPGSWPLTPRGAAAAEAFDQESMLPGIDCIPFSSPFLMVLPDVKVIEIREPEVRIRSEFEDVERVIHTDGRSHDGAPRSLQGHSVGSWEDGVLVVDTVGFAEHRVGNAMGVPSGADKRLIERLELAPDGQSLTYRFELHDREYLTEPVSGAVRWSHRPDATYAPAECDEENARRFILD